MSQVDYHYNIATNIAKLLDNQFKIFNFRIGIEPLIAAIPGIGDLISFALSAYLLWIGVKMNLPKDALAKMTSNIVVDFLIGLVPVVGDIGDIFYKANSRNMQILKKYRTQIVDVEFVK